MMETSQVMVSCYPVNHMLMDLAMKERESHMKNHEKESIHPIALSPNISSFEDEIKSLSVLICNEKKNQIFYMLWKYKLDKKFYLTFEENRSFLYSMTAKICFKMLMKSRLDLFPSSQSSIWVYIDSEIDKHQYWFQDWQTLKLALFTTFFFYYNQIAKLKVCLKVVLNCIDCHQSGGWGYAHSCTQFWPSKKSWTSTQLIELYFGVSEQIKPQQPIGQAAEFQPVPISWQSLPKAIREHNWGFRLQNHWPSSWGSAPAQLGRGGWVSTNTGCSRVGSSRCWLRTACLRKTCYQSYDTDSVGQSKGFNAL